MANVRDTRRRGRIPLVSFMGGGPAAKARSIAETGAIPWWADAFVDIGSAAASASLLAPFVTIVDKAVVEASAGRSSLARAVFNNVSELVLRPHRFFLQPSLWMVAGVYGATYSAANLIDSACERLLDRDDPKSASIHGGVKLVGTTCVNMLSGITKDMMFARMFGSSGATGPMPKATIGLFALRDVLTIGAAFTLPKYLAQLLSSASLVEEKYAGETAQMVSPIMMQLPCSPIHLLALNVYNERGVSARERFISVGRLLPQTTIARMCRMAPAYGIGGVANTSLVHRGRDYNLHVYYTAPNAAAAQVAAQTGSDDTFESRTSGYAGTVDAPPSASPVASPSLLHRRRIVDTYTSHVADAVDLYGDMADVDAAAIEKAVATARLETRNSDDLIASDTPGGGIILRRNSSRHFEPAQAGYYPEVSRAVEKALIDSGPLAGVFGDARDVPDADSKRLVGGVEPESRDAK